MRPTHPCLRSALLASLVVLMGGLPLVTSACNSPDKGTPAGPASSAPATGAQPSATSTDTASPGAVVPPLELGPGPQRGGGTRPGPVGLPAAGDAGASAANVPVPSGVPALPPSLPPFPSALALPSALPTTFPSIALPPGIPSTLPAGFPTTLPSGFPSAIPTTWPAPSH